jgi:hypothetical protein
MIYQKTIIQEKFDAKDIRDFYYRDTEYSEQGGTGVRTLAKEYIRKGKMVERHLTLKDNGNTLEIVDIFPTKEDYDEWRKEPVHTEASEFFSHRTGRKITVEIEETQDNLSIRYMALGGYLMWLSEKSPEECKEGIIRFLEGPAWKNSL